MSFINLLIEKPRILFLTLSFILLANRIKERVRNNILGFSIRRFIKLIVYLETYLQ